MAKFVFGFVGRCSIKAARVGGWGAGKERGQLQAGVFPSQLQLPRNAAFSFVRHPGCLPDRRPVAPPPFRWEEEFVGGLFPLSCLSLVHVLSIGVNSPEALSCVTWPLRVGRHLGSQTPCPHFISSGLAWCQKPSVSPGLLGSAAEARAQVGWGQTWETSNLGLVQW